MKLNKATIVRIIKEELSAIVLEKEASRAQKLFKQIFSDLRGMGKSKDEAFEKAREMVSDAPKGAAAPGLKFEDEGSEEKADINIAELYTDYSEDPVEALELRRDELRDQIWGGNPDSMDAYNEYERLGAELAKLRANLQENQIYDEIDEEIDHLESVLVGHMPSWASDRYSTDSKLQGLVRDDLMKLTLQKGEVYEYIEEMTFAVRRALQGDDYESPESLDKLSIEKSYIRPIGEAREPYGRDPGGLGGDPMTRSVRGWDYGRGRRARGADVMGTAQHPPPEAQLRKKAFHEIAKLIRHQLPLPWRVKEGDPLPPVEDIISAVLDHPVRGINNGPYMGYEKKRFLSIFNERNRENIVNKVIKDYYEKHDIVFEE